MSEGRRQRDRQLAMDVWRLWTDKKVDEDSFIERGSIVERKRYPLPPNPLIHQKIAEIRERQRQQREAVKQEIAAAREVRRAAKKRKPNQ
jgi:hypothetical protein